MFLASGHVGLEVMNAFIKRKLALKRETMGFKLRSRRFQKKKKGIVSEKIDGVVGSRGCRRWRLGRGWRGQLILNGKGHCCGKIVGRMSYKLLEMLDSSEQGRANGALSSIQI